MCQSAQNLSKFHNVKNGTEVVQIHIMCPCSVIEIRMWPNLHEMVKCVQIKIWYKVGHILCTILSFQSGGFSSYRR